MTISSQDQHHFQNVQPPINGQSLFWVISVLPVVQTCLLGTMDDPGNVLSEVYSSETQQRPNIAKVKGNLPRLLFLNILHKVTLLS